MALKHDLEQIQRLTYDAYLSSGKLMALEDGGRTDPAKLAKTYDAVAAQLESSVVAVRNLCERNRPLVIPGFEGKTEQAPIRLAGRAEVNEHGWLHIELNALLPHCRRHAPKWLSDTIVRLLLECEVRGQRLPFFKKAMLILDEHCDIPSRRVYDQDNKGWKAVANALKGRLIEDDDQFTLSVSLLSTLSKAPACHIYLLPLAETGDFFALKYDYQMLP